MNRIKITSIIFSLFFFGLQTVAQAERANLKEQFLNNDSIIYTINIRSFGAVDNNKDGLIDLSKGDIRGTFLNAKEKLPMLKEEGINTVYLLPITKTGKLKALGTAGSLYALDSFSELNEQLDDITTSKTIKQQAKEFVDYAHSLDLNVIVDLPSCGSYDLSLNKPSWFIKNEDNESVIPADWTDVRLFKIYNTKGTLYEPMVKNFKDFIDMVQDIGFDGIRADVAAIKPYEFWKEIIDYATSKNKNFIFIAEANTEWSNPASDWVYHYSTVKELLKAGFIGYYGSWSDFNSVKSKKVFDLKIEKNLKILKQNKNSALLGAFATHDQQAPILKGKNYWSTVLWLNTTLPLNSYFLDGFSTGDDFIYPYENKKAHVTYTDDEYYFVHNGMFDIFNLSASSNHKHPEYKKEYIKAIKFKKDYSNVIKPYNYKTINTHSDNIFAYKLSDSRYTILVIGSLNDKKRNSIKVRLKEIQPATVTMINSKIIPNIKKGSIKTSLQPMEIQVYLIKKSIQ